MAGNGTQGTRLIDIFFLLLNKLGYPQHLACNFGFDHEHPVPVGKNCSLARLPFVRVL
jgi:hypothetical protein